MENIPFFSIITPLYNLENLIGSTIESVIKQTFKFWELLIIDDGSTDKSYLVAQRYSLLDERINVIHQPDGINRGVSSARNIGINKARGAWLAFLDADDIWLETKLEKQYRVIVSNYPNLVFVYCSAFVINENADIENHTYGAGREGLSIKPFKWVIRKGFEAPTSSVVISKKIIDDNYIRFEEELSSVEDTLFWLEVVVYGDIYYINEPLLSYRVHSLQWNARTPLETKHKRRLLLYSQMISPRFSEHLGLIFFLLVNKGLRLSLIFFLSREHFSVRNVMKVLYKVISMRIPLIYKIFSFCTLASELLMIPLRWNRSMIIKWRR